ncbi:hypothetical protein [Turicimonas sp. TL08]
MGDTTADIRLQNLNFLIEQYKTIANLNIALGRDRRDSTLSQIKNRVKINNSKGRRTMGFELARTIEEKLNLPGGWMDEFHENIQPEIPKLELVNLSDLKKLSSIPLFIQPSNADKGRCDPKLNGEIQLPNYFIDGLIQEPNSELKGFMPNESAMFKTLPQGSIVLVNCRITHYEGDGLYLVLINNFHKFRKITQLLDGNYMIESDINKEVTSNLESLEVLGKVTNIWINQKA